MTVASVLAVAVGGAAGAALRAFVSHLGNRRAPWGTLGVNWAGSALLGALLAFQPGLPEWLWIGLGVGLCGGFTTFSTCLLEAAKWWRAGLRARSLAYLLATFGGSLGLILLALRLASRLTSGP